MEIPFLKEILLWNVSRSKAKYWCRGASVIISRENFEKVGRWCEEYFIYGEDMDLFYSFWKHNLEIITLEVPVFHYGGGCSQNVWSNLQREIIVQKSFRRFFRRHSNMLHYTLVKLYYLMFNLIKHPKRVLFDIKAWYKSF
jgi:GT2 family glycosyltransferase